MATANYSDVVADANNWVDVNPDYAVLLASVGGGANTDRNVAKTHLVNLATQSPTLLAFVLNGDPAHIQVGCAPSSFPVTIGFPTFFDNRVVVLVGNDVSTAVAVVLPEDATSRSNPI